MRKIKYLVVLFTISIMNGQVNTELKEKMVDLDKTLYQNALKYNDFVTAINSVHKIIAKEGTTSTYKDSLAVLYFKSNNYESSYLVTNELLIKKPQDIKLLEINMLSAKNLGDTKYAIAGFKKLFTLSNNPYHGYELANLQLKLKLLTDAQITIEKAIKCKELKDFSLPFPNEEEENTQKVPLKSALLYLKGLIYFELKNIDVTKKAYEEALLVFPEFVMAQQNRKALDK